MSDIITQPSDDMLIAAQRENEETPTDEARKLAIKEQALKAMEEDHSENQEQAGDSNSEGSNRAARRLLEKEKKLREMREAFEAEQAQKVQEFESSKAEWEEKIAKFESASEEARYNPVEYLQSLGLNNEELQDVARVIFFINNEDLATDEVKSRINEIKYRQELKRLENKFESKLKEKEPEKAPDNSELVKYQETLVEASKSIPEDKFPLTAKYASQAQELEIANAMYAAAYQHAVKTEGKGAPLTPEECLEQVEAQLKRMQLNNLEQSTQPEQRTTVRNRTTKVVSDTDESKLSFEEQRQIARARAKAVLQEKGLL